MPVLRGYSRMTACLAGAALAAGFSLTALAQDQPAAPTQSPLDLVNALHTAFGAHHARAVHTKGVMVEGSFTPDPAAQSISSAPIFAGGGWWPEWSRRAAPLGTE